MSIGIYSVFLWVQNRRHRGFFMAPDEAADVVQAAPAQQSARSTLSTPRCSGSTACRWSCSRNKWRSRSTRSWPHRRAGGAGDS